MVTDYNYLNNYSPRTQKDYLTKSTASALPDEAIVDSVINDITIYISN